MKPRCDLIFYFCGLCFLDTFRQSSPKNNFFLSAKEKTWKFDPTPLLKCEKKHGGGNMEERGEGEHLERRAPDRNQWCTLAEALCVSKHEDD